MPFRKDLVDFSARNDYRLDDLVLYGGEEYEIVGTIPKDKIERAKTIARSLKSELTVIGETTSNRRIETSAGDSIEKKGWIQLA